MKSTAMDLSRSRTTRRSALMSALQLSGKVDHLVSCAQRASGNCRSSLVRSVLIGFRKNRSHRRALRRSRSSPSALTARKMIDFCYKARCARAREREREDRFFLSARRAREGGYVEEGEQAACPTSCSARGEMQSEVQNARRSLQPKRSRSCRPTQQRPQQQQLEQRSKIRSTVDTTA